MFRPTSEATAATSKPQPIQPAGIYFKYSRQSQCISRTCGKASLHHNFYDTFFGGVASLQVHVGTKMIGQLLHFVTLVGSRSSTAPASATSPAASAATPAAGAAAATPAAQAQALQASMAGGPHLSKSLDVLSMLSIILGTA